MYRLKSWSLHSKFLSIHGAKANVFSTTASRYRLRKSSQQHHLLHKKTLCWAPLRAPFPFRYFSYSTEKIAPTQQRRNIKVLELSISNLDSSGHKGEVEVTHTIIESNTVSIKQWDTVCDARKSQTEDASNEIRGLPKKAISMLLPAEYPRSVAQGYLRFVSFCFVASVAGSAAMVLSTQTLLLAVGIVGQSSGSNGVMAGALNWVMKDFMGQLGGIIFASQTSKTKAFDNDPKRWRMVAALALDGATMLEILAPLCHQNLVLPLASIANVGKNIGFLTVSASRAALHQSLSISGNLGDVTVKAGSQSMMASLVGTSLGIGLSTLLHHDTFNFGICFLCLSVIHQGCTYISLKHVPLDYFNRHRFHLAIEYHLKNQMIPSPLDVAKSEKFFPFLSSDSSSEWLLIGRSLREVCQTPMELQKYLTSAPGEAYLIQWNKKTHKIDIVFFADATEQDVCRGIYHACLLRYKVRQMDTGKPPMSKECVEGTIDRESYSFDDSYEIIDRKSHLQVQQNFQHFLNDLHKQGWDISSGVVDAEDKKSHRIQISAIN